MGMKRGIAAVAFAAALVGLAGPAAQAAPTAQAEDVSAQAGRFWLYEHDDKGGGAESFGGTDCDLRNNYWDNGDRVVDNNASSMDNNTDFDVRLWDYRSRSGDSYIARAHSEDKNFTDNGFDNKASCVVFLP